MKKPELEDFGLTEEDLELYNKQEMNYYKCLDEHCEYLKSIKKTVICVSLIITFIVLIINIALGFEDEEGAAMTLVICVFWDITVVSYCFSSLNDSAWDIRESKKSEIRALTMDTSLKEAVDSYQKALREYERHIKKLQREFWINLSGYEFEREVASLFRSKGYNATVTSATGDGGVDVILVKGDERIAVQCKHHSKPVGPNDVRALQGVVASQKYTKGIFVSLNGYTQTVYNEVRIGYVPIDLWDLSDIIKMADDFPEAPQKPPVPPKPPRLPNDPKPPVPPLPPTPPTTPFMREPQIGDTVIHKFLGQGKIINITTRANAKGKKYIDVDFGENFKSYNFKHPDAFWDGFLSFQDEI